jgi:hypothetical protein
MDHAEFRVLPTEYTEHAEEMELSGKHTNLFNREGLGSNLLATRYSLLATILFNREVDP